MPDTRLIDTNIAIYVASRHPTASRYAQHLDGRTLVLSFVSAAEVMYTSRRARDPGATLAFWRSTLPTYTVLFPDLETCEIWSTISASVHRRGRPRPDNDLWIAATALRHDLTLVTHNRRDFADIPDLTVISEAPGSH